MAFVLSKAAQPFVRTILWPYSEYILTIFWTYSDSFSSYFFIFVRYFDHILTIFCHYFGHIVTKFLPFIICWLFSDHIVIIFWPDNILTISWPYFDHILIIFKQSSDHTFHYLIIFWAYSDHIITMFWLYSEHDLNILRRFSNHIHSGHTMLWQYSDQILAIFHVLGFWKFSFRFVCPFVHTRYGYAHFCVFHVWFSPVWCILGMFTPTFPHFGYGYSNFIVFRNGFTPIFVYPRYGHAYFWYGYILFLCSRCRYAHFCILERPSFVFPGMVTPILVWLRPFDKKFLRDLCVLYMAATRLRPYTYTAHIS